MAIFSGISLFRIVLFAAIGEQDSIRLPEQLNCSEGV